MNQDENKFQEQEFKFSKISPQTLYCVLSYIYILWIIGFLSDKNNKIVKFHVNQGIILSTVSLFSLIIINILSSCLYSIAPILASISAFLEVSWIIFYVVFTTVGIKTLLNKFNSHFHLLGHYSIL